VSLPPSAVLQFLNECTLPKEKEAVAQSVLHEVYAKLETLISLGLDHLALDRDCRTLSSGELQRVRLTAALGSSLSGVLYLLDEPSAGLHPADNRLVLDKIQMLRDAGNSVVIIEHDPESILAAEHVVELGPGGGSDGGAIVFNGSMAAFLDSDTRTSLGIKHPPAVSGNGATNKQSGELLVHSGVCNNVTVKNLSLPLHTFVVFCGVSGAGKSSLVHGIVADTLIEEMPETTASVWHGTTGSLEATSPIEKILIIDQQPIGKNSRSTPGSYLGVWDHIRKLYAQTTEAKSLGWTSSYFSYNTGDGRCPACEGRGELKLEMNFLANAAITCDACEGRRFSDEANAIRYLGISIADALSLTFEEAKKHFANHPKIRRPLDRACALGLGYLTLGQSSVTLSGGEAQRLKLVAELNTRQSAHTLYILDEPTTGLHLDDVAKLVTVIRELVDLGNSVFVIEHDPSVLLAADHVVEIGPGPGAAGGKVIFQGTPKSLAKKQTPWGNILAHMDEPLHQLPKAM
jgi:excinuclease ABC subunit A